MARAPSDRDGPPPLDAAALDRLAVDYVGRYATTRAKLRAYLDRKLAQRGWVSETPPPLDATVARLAAAGYVDDRAFAASRAASLARRGYGARRIGEALRVAGIDGEDAAPALDLSEEEAWSAAWAFAKRRRFGAFSVAADGPERRRKALAAMLRAGHPLAISRAIIAGRGDVRGDPDR